MKGSNSARRMELWLLVAGVALALVFGLYVLLFEKDLGAGLLKAMFGLSGGNTAGG